MNERLDITLKILENSSLSTMEIAQIMDNLKIQKTKGRISEDEYQVIHLKLEQLNLKLHILGTNYKKRTIRI